MASTLLLTALLPSLFEQSFALPLLSRSEMIPRKLYTSSRRKSRMRVSVGVLAAIVIVAVLLVLAIAAIYFIRRRRRQGRIQSQRTLEPGRVGGDDQQQQYYIPPPPPQLGMDQQQPYQKGH